MKRAVRLMLLIILGVAVVLALAVGSYLFWRHRQAANSNPKPPTASEIKQLRVDLPEMTTNLKDGLVQFTLSLEADSAGTKTELMDLQPQVQDAVNRTLREFAAGDLKSQAGLAKVKGALLDAVNAVLPQGRITGVYFATVVVQ
ncbi:MAG: flagellar basal body-associated FliL family protein [Alicyclobacillus sp.]|nr:flagellar basal body-associated FliL family protein [Alicyclobacillus sp.]